VAGHTDVKAWDQVNPVARDLQTGQMDIGGKLGGVEQRLEPEWVPVLGWGWLVGIKGERPAPRQLLRQVSAQVQDMDCLRGRPLP
jgi:hypothetical protein